MKKIILLVLGLVFMFSSLASANDFSERVSKILNNQSTPRIVMVLAGDKNVLSEERNIKEIKESIEKKFPKNKYDVVEDKKVYQDLLIIGEDREIVNLDELKRADFVDIGKKHGYDYVMVLPFYNEGGYYTSSGWTNMVSQKITIRARSVDVKTGEYIYRLDTTEQGESANGFGAPSLVRAQREGIEKCLKTIFSELSIGEKMVKK